MLNQFKPSKSYLREIKERLIEHLSDRNIYSDDELEMIRHCHVDDVLDLFFSASDSVAITLKDGRHIVILPGGRVVQ